MPRKSFQQLIARFSTSISCCAAQKGKVVKRKGEYLFGIAPCLAALQAKRRKVHAIFLKQGGEGNKKRQIKNVAIVEVQNYAQQHKMDIHYVSREILDRLSQKRPHQVHMDLNSNLQGMVLDADPLRFKRLNPGACKTRAQESGKPPIWLALDEIHDPMNFGAILRCALFLGVERVVATAKNFCHLSPVVSKASSGAMELMQVYSVGSMTTFLKEAGMNSWHVVGTCSPDNLSVSQGKEGEAPVMDCHHYVLQGPTILVLGNEGAGLRKAVMRVCTTMLTIAPLRQLPMGFDSLNVAVATGILLHHFQRHN